MIMKYIDKFLSKLKTDRNTFVTYVLTLISVYICIDRIAEILFMIFSGFCFLMMENKNILFDYYV